MSAEKKICCFGELLLRYSPEMNGVFIKEATMPVYIGGAELNVATALANWDVPVKYHTALPSNYLSEEIIDYIRSQNIDASVFSKAGRIGNYILPQGKDLKNNSVIYDRDHSSFSELKPGELNWEEILEGCDWFHFSAISPALNQDIVEVCIEALEHCRKTNIRVSVDLNYRAKLWNYGKQPAEIMPRLVEYCDLIMGNIWSAEKLLSIGLPGSGFDSFQKNEYTELAHQTAGEIMKKYRHCSAVANTFRFDKGEGIEYFATISSADKQVVSSTYESANIIDKVGSGDCFMAALIYGLYHQKPLEEIVNFASAAAVDKLNQRGDASKSSIDQVMKNVLING